MINDSQKKKFHGAAFQNLKEGIDVAGVEKTLTWSKSIDDIGALLNEIVVDGVNRPAVVIEIQVVGGVKLKVVSKALIAFERKYHYLSQPSRIRESSRSILGIDGIVRGINKHKILSIVDFSGRMGIASAIMKGHLEPAVHHINDAEEAWLPHLKKNFPEAASLTTLPFFNSFQTMPDADLALVDYCSFIPARDFHTIIPVLQRKHKHIILTDASPFMWHLNRNSYTRGMFTAPKNHDTYIAKFSDYLADNYGYYITRSIRRNTICTHLLIKGTSKYRGEIVSFSDLYKTTDKGFQIHVKMKGD